MVDRITFARSLYFPEGVQAAAAVYEGVAQITVDLGPEETVASIIEADPDVADEIVDAFSNQALFETIVRSRRAAAARP
jgi:hypothetical protein